MSVPIVDLSLYLNRKTAPEAYAAEAAKAAKSLHTFGCLLLKDPRVDESHNDRFVDMLENYFNNSDGQRDARPELSYQVGVTPDGMERPRDHCSGYRSSLLSSEQPVTPCPPGPDLKWRFFWRIGPTPNDTRYPSLNADPVVPEEFPEWPTTMDMWGGKMLAALEALAGMAATGFGLPEKSFQDMMYQGPHLLAPTGSNFYDSKTREITSDRALAGFHYDLNFLTIHGKSRFPGLYVWLRDGRRLPVKVPRGHLLVQAGRQMEWLTGGHVKAGFHEVIVTDATVAEIEKREKERKSLWRVSSTLFGHIASDQPLRPLGHFSSPESRQSFPVTDAGKMVQDELNAIDLGVGSKIDAS
uniref:Isopenicillin N synthase-like Fe(2+) 2OG dioxygenase domain-containing protein n=1 Tax=Octactis speculum TaxID=3111310 RepID=A0A7S2G785_9STRA|eukprot:CAMPEP_0185772786 /NCGR_PEP_ID=MMETSP1174-20130828/70848_1 /TAXON_ID=35687 /ORGANISM="Dictyocha speculum, Strain CCMP1381" /LENGTH=355 /DNA_ID=CAMNT_0028459219 /DNA_START=85 /DNA_END=1152 /DNA_ORIENTATION=-